LLRTQFSVCKSMLLYAAGVQRTTTLSAESLLGLKSDG